MRLPLGIRKDGLVVDANGRIIISKLNPCDLDERVQIVEAVNGVGAAKRKPSLPRFRIDDFDRPPTIYIAGPMTGCVDFNYPKFNAFAAALRKIGWIVKNPVEIAEAYGTAGEIASSPKLLDRVLEAELKVVRNCSAIYLLRGWERSNGARVELAAALASGIQVFVEEDA